MRERLWSDQTSLKRERSHRESLVVPSSLRSAETARSWRFSEASRRYDSHHPGRSPNHFIAYARPYVNGEITHYLRDKGFLISVPGRWRELHARGQKLLRQGVSADQLPTRLGISLERWSDIVAACSVRVVAMTISAEDDQNP